MKSRLPRDVAEKTVKVFLSCDSNQTRTADALGIERSTLQHRLKRAAEYGLIDPPPKPIPHGQYIRERSKRYDRNGDLVSQSVKTRSEPGEEFKPLTGHAIKGESALLDADGRVINRWVKTGAEQRDAALSIDAIKGAFAEFSGAAPVSAMPDRSNDDLLTCYVIGDHHLGMFSWGEETGEDYDLKEAERLLKAATSHLVAMSPPSKTAVLLNLGDFFHADTNANRTERSGNPLDVDTRMTKVKKAGVALLIHCIGVALTKHEKVIVRCVQGNHDYESAGMLSIALDCFYRDDKRVEVDTSPSPFFVMRFGNVLISSTHGDQAKANDMPGVIASRWPQEWGATTHRYAYMGHVHHSASGGERHGLKWESFQTLAAKDAWHSGMGYTSNRSMTAITHHRNRGEVERHMIGPEGLE